MAMNLQETNSFTLHSNSTLEDILIKKLLLSHDPDDRRLDSDQLLHAMENIMFYATISEISDLDFIDNDEGKITDIEAFGFKETLSHLINKISHEILCKCSGEGSLHEKTMILFDLLGNYRWDAKAVIVLATFVKSYGEFWLLIQLYPRNTLALSVAMLKQLPSDLSAFTRQFKALSLLMKTVIDLTKCVIKYESLPLSQVKLDKENKSITQYNIYLAVYWIIRSILTCSFQVSALKAMTPVQLGLPELKNKVVLLLITKPELLPIEELLLLVQQTCDNPYNEILEESYEIVWMPIPDSNSWTDAEKRSFRVLSQSIPWCSIKQPWSLNSGVVTFIKQEWNYRDDPIMVVLDSQGNLSNLNALDLIFIWGVKAYPFSNSREKELWEEQSWNLQLLVDEIDPLITNWVNENRYICIYGSEDIDWILEFNSKLKKIRNSGLQLEMVYVGTRNESEKIQKFLSLIQEEGLRDSLFSLCLTKRRSFWLRLESIIRSKLKLGYSLDTDQALQEASALVNNENSNKSWVAIGRGSSNDIVRVEGSKMMECLNRFLEWEAKVGKLGFLGALRTAIDPPLSDEPCGHESKTIPYGEEEELVEDMRVCEKCKLPWKKFVIYK
ncbi:hypothetical protein CsatA_012063 [Cannabis sativa]